MTVDRARDTNRDNILIPPKTFLMPKYSLHWYPKHLILNKIHPVLLRPIHYMFKKEWPNAKRYHHRSYDLPQS